MKESKAGEATANTGTPHKNSVWINPIGGLGDTLMLSGVLKQVVDRFPGRKFMLVRRPGYMSILQGHPAIAGTGFPRQEDTVLSTDYWAKEALGENSGRPMQILARTFGLEGLIEENLYFAGEAHDDPLLSWIPWSSKNVVIAPGSASPRKEWAHEKWEGLASRLSRAGCFALLVGTAGQRYVRHTYSLLGLTTPGQVFPLLRRADLIITVDCFVMHAAHYLKQPAIVLWGPTHPGVYGYNGQVHLYHGDGCTKPDGCLGPGKGDLYSSPCPLASGHCVDRISVEEVLAAAGEILSTDLLTIRS